MTEVVIEQLTVEYPSPDQPVRPLAAFDLSVTSGSLVVLLGPSGSGKTTLLSCLAGILTPTSGQIRVGDLCVTDLDRPGLLRYRRNHVGIVFQAFNLLASLTALENVMAPIMAAGTSRREATARASALLDDVDLHDRIGHRPGALSGGQQQRVAIARALAHDPPLLLADEPTAHLDAIQVALVADLLRRLVGPGRSAIIATHDTRLLDIADRVVDLSDPMPALEMVPESPPPVSDDPLFYDY